MAALLVRLLRRGHPLDRGAHLRLEPRGSAVAKLPGFVYGIVVSLFVLFSAFSVKLVLQYKKVAPWRDYLFGEQVYILLSLTAKALLPWQVFGAVLGGAAR